MTDLQTLVAKRRAANAAVAQLQVETLREVSEYLTSPERIHDIDLWLEQIADDDARNVLINLKTNLVAAATVIGLAVERNEKLIAEDA
jgi:hypothetical protein